MKNINETAISVLHNLENNGYIAYLVGGYCRDLYMGKESSDYDICTNAKPKEIKNIFARYIVPSDHYGCVTIFIDNKRFEITTFREDITYFNHRFPIKLKYVNDLKTDLQRRDFRMNTICIDSNGNYIDLLNGREDIDNRIIRMVGNPDQKIKEDALRILRAIRFSTILNFELDESLKNSIIKYRSLVKNLSYERRKKELDKIFNSSNHLRGLNLIREFELDKYLEININNVIPTTHAIGYWAQVDYGKYKFNKSEKDQIEKIKKLWKLNVLDNTNLYKYGIYISTVVGELQGIDKQAILEKYDNLAIKDKKDIAIAPLEICNVLNKQPDYFLKDIITDIELKLINNELVNDKTSLIQYIIENYKEK